MKHLLTPAVLLIVTAIAAGGAAEAKGNKKNQIKDQPDAMVVKMEGDDNFHMQPVSHKACLTFMHMLTEKPGVLTMRNPYIQGKVLEAHCILPDGSMIDSPTKGP